jgi:hypothetical protein
MHQFKVGQDLIYSPRRISLRGPCRIIALLPTSGDHEPRYRIKRRGDTRTRIARQSDLELRPSHTYRWDIYHDGSRLALLGIITGARNRSAAIAKAIRDFDIPPSLHEQLKAWRREPRMRPPRRRAS